MSDLVQELSEIASRVAKLASTKGAGDAEVIIRDGSELTAKVRMGEPELIQEAGSRAVGLRVFCDRKSAITYTSDLRPEALVHHRTSRERGNQILLEVQEAKLQNHIRSDTQSAQ